MQHNFDLELKKILSSGADFLKIGAGVSVSLIVLLVGVLVFLMLRKKWADTSFKAIEGK